MNFNNSGTSVITRCVHIYFFLAVLLLFAGVTHAQSLPTDALAGCTRSGSTYTCNSSLSYANDTTYTLTGNTVINVSGNFDAQKNFTVVTNGFTLTLTVTGNVDLKKSTNLGATVNISANGNFTTAKDAIINGNLSVGGNVDVGQNGTINGNVTANGNIKLNSGTVVNGSCNKSPSGGGTCQSKQNQTITFGAQTTPRTYAVGGTFAINPTATASSGLAVTYSSTTPTICTVSGTTVTMTAASGTCTLAANQAGNGTYNAAPQVTQIVEIDPLLLSDWRMDETTAYSGVAGEVNNSVSGGTNGTGRRSANNLPLTAAFPSNISGKLCGGVDFNGKNYLLVTGLSSQLSGTASLSFWVKTTQVGNNTPWSAPGVSGVEKGGTDGANDIFWGYINATGKMGLHKGNTAGAKSTSSINDGTWRHIVMTRNTSSPGETKIYVNGVLENTLNMVDLSVVTTAFSSLGRVENSYSPSGLIGALDEVKVFAPVLSDTQVASIYANESAGKNWDGSARVCPVSGPHHLEILHASGTGLTCAASTLTVRACADTACTALYTGGVSGTLIATGTPTVNWDGATGGATGAGFVIAAGASSVTKNVQVTSVGSVVFGLTTPTTPAASNPTTCNFGSPSCTFSASSAGFLFSNTATGNTFTIPPQVAGTATAANAIFLRAVKSASTTAAVCTPAIISQTGVGVTMGYSCNNPSSCQPGSLLTVNATAVPPSGSSVSMDFDANGSSPITLNYADVGQITVNASKLITPTGGTAVTFNGSSNAFVVKPGGFVLSNIKCTTYGATTCAPALAAPGNNPAAASATGAAFIQAGRNFSATVTATTSGGATTPNYGKETSPESVKLTSTLVTGQGLTNNPTLTNNTAFGTFASGVASGTTFSWGDVGIITLTPSVGDGDYLGAGDVTGTTSGNVGRFIPDHFTLISSSIVPAFAYMDQPFTVNYTLEARNALGDKTSNYTGAYARGVVSVAAENANNGTDLVARLTGLTDAWSNGSYGLSTANNATFARGGSPVSPDGPYDALAFGVKVTDSDGPVLQGLDMNPATTATDVACVAGGAVTNCTHKKIGNTQIRFGQMVLFPGYGSELVNLAMPIQTQYWNGSAFAINTWDSSTAITGTQVGFVGLTPTKVAPSASTPLSISGGTGVLKLNSSGTIGKAQVTIDLSSMPWLQGNSGGASGYTSSPTAPAVFGLYKKSNKVIFSRERY